MKDYRVGFKNINNNGNEMEIIEYRGARDIIVKFLDGSITHTSYSHFKNGGVSSIYDKTVYNIGYLGEEPSYINGKALRQYSVWKDMIMRCYDEKHLLKYPTYKDCKVCEEWHNYSNFKKWYDNNYYEVEDNKMCLDKDILIKGNKVYSPETCIFTPERINQLFVKRDCKRGSLPIGVTFFKRDGVYMSQLRNMAGNNIYLGRYKTPEEAFCSYKNAKEELIKQIADEYKDKIPKRLYEAMYKYEVEITD